MDELNLNRAVSIEKEEEHAFDFSICTLVTDKEEYAAMMESYIEAGFDLSSCEYLYIDNSKANKWDAYQGLNLFLQKAKGRYIIICHQDIFLHDDDRSVLTACILEMDRLDPKWGILANAGGAKLKYNVQHLTRGTNGKRLIEEHLPIKVDTVDENFMLVKKEANLALSSDLRGFHMYGTDICLIARVLGYNAYVIPFNLMHKSDGYADRSFYDAKDQLVDKYKKAFEGRYLFTTMTRFYLSGRHFFRPLLSSQLMVFFARQYYRYFSRKSKYRVRGAKLDHL